MPPVGVVAETHTDHVARPTAEEERWPHLTEGEDLILRRPQSQHRERPVTPDGASVSGLPEGWAVGEPAAPRGEPHEATVTSHPPRPADPVPAPHDD